MKSNSSFGNCVEFHIQQGTNIQERLLNKPYVNEVTLRGQNPPLTTDSILNFRHLSKWN